MMGGLNAPDYAIGCDNNNAIKMIKIIGKHKLVIPSDAISVRIIKHIMIEVRR